MISAKSNVYGILMILEGVMVLVPLALLAVLSRGRRISSVFCGTGRRFDSSWQIAVFQAQDACGGL